MKNPGASGSSKVKIAVIAVLAIAVIGGALSYSSSGKGAQGLIRLNPIRINFPKANITFRLTASADTTGLDTGAKSDQKLAKVKFSNSGNFSDAAENNAIINKLRILVYGSNASASNYVLYPDDKYSDASYAIIGKVVSKVVGSNNTHVIEFNFGDAKADGAVVGEGMSRTYAIKADTVSGINGSLDVSISKTGTSSSSQYSSDSDVLWTEADSGILTAPTAWLNGNSGNVNLRYFFSAYSTGFPDLNN